MEEENVSFQPVFSLFIWHLLLIKHCNTEQGNATHRVPYYQLS